MTLADLKATVLAALILVTFVISPNRSDARDIQTMIVAGGCFWCVESDFERVRGVREVVSGYTGGNVNDPSYRQVTSGGTGHFEAVEITYDADQVSYRQLLDLFFRSIDPTDAGGQFCDRGASYRTAIFVSTTDQQRDALAAKAAAEAELGRSIVTPILQEAEFYEAEAYHQDYYKGQSMVLTRAGPKTQAEAYKFYREGCGRDARVRQLWGDNAPFAG